MSDRNQVRKAKAPLEERFLFLTDALSPANQSTLKPALFEVEDRITGATRHLKLWRKTNTAIDDDLRRLVDAMAWAASLALSEDHVSPANCRRLSGPGLRTFLRIAEQWHLTTDEQANALGMSKADFARQSEVALAGGDVTLPLDVLLRLSAILGIYKVLVTLFGDRGLEWLNGPHGALWSDGRRPKDVMTSGNVESLLACRRHLDQLCG